MELLSLIFWQVLLLGVTVQPSEEVEAVCTGTTCYTLHLGKHSWMEAQQKCENNGGNLMTLKRREEALLVQQLLDKMPKGATGQDGKVRLWIGLHREKGKCYQKHQLLKGFSWVTGGEDTEYVNWELEPRATCTAMRCVALQCNPSSVQGLAWVDSHCSSLTADGEAGYLCKFSFQGMCRPLVLAGPGTVQYKTPFGVSTNSLAAVPFGSIADVACDAQGGEVTNAFLVCKPHPKSNTSEWSSPGPFCASPTYGCSYNKGGCEHACVDMSGGSFQCTCPSGYQLGSDNLSCNPVNYCSSNPCQGQCLTRPDGFECTCPLGYALANDGLNCVDVDECSSPQSPCEQICVNTMGSFTCFCQKGYKAAGRRCEDIDECSTGMPCEQLCVNTHGSFLCSCNLGYHLEGINSSSCLDVDECDEEPCEHTCTNSLGSYQCSCRAGWTLAPNKISCIQDSADKRPPQSTQGDAEPIASTTTHPTSETPELPSNASVQSELETLFMSQAFTLHPGVLSSPLDAEDQDSEGSVDKNSANSRELLYYILGGMLVLLLMVCAFSLVTYRKMKAKKARKKSASAADHYSWVPEQGETRA